MKQEILKYIKRSILRIVLTMVMLFCVFHEVRVCTFVLFCMIFFHIELNNLADHFRHLRDKELIECVQLMAKKIMEK